MVSHAVRVGAGQPSWGQGLAWVYVDGEFLEADHARVSPYAHVLSYGTGTFEGIRAFWNADHEELYLLEAAAHYERMAQSARVLGLTLPHSTGELVRLTQELLRRNGVRADAYVRPLLALAGEELPVRMHDIESRFALAASSLSGAYLAEGGLRCMISTWRRSPDTVLPSRAKIAGSYVGPALAKTEAVRHGFDDAIMLNTEGYVAEATTANIFLRRGQRWITPGPTEDILEGITRRQVMELLEEATGVAVEERRVDRSELYIADEVFLCGTAAQVVPVVDIDDRPVAGGAVGAETAALRNILLAIARREDSRHTEWTTPVYNETKEKA